MQEIAFVNVLGAGIVNAGLRQRHERLNPSRATARLSYPLSLRQIPFQGSHLGLEKGIFNSTDELKDCCMLVASL